MPPRGPSPLLPARDGRSPPHHGVTLGPCSATVVGVLDRAAAAGHPVEG